MPKERKVKCPFFGNVSRKDKAMATITCEKIETKLGFDTRNQLLFPCHEEKQNYLELFCCDMYDTCPYYRSIYRYKCEK